jgi:dTMP kinase
LALFVSFEGGEGSGKSTQAKVLHNRLLQANVPAVLTQEPGGTPLGTKARRLLKLSEQTEISPLAELFLIVASRAQLVTEVIRPSLDGGTAVICDRYADSSVAYQGYGRGIDLDFVHAVNRVATQGIFPQLVVFLDMPVEAGLARKGSIGRDRFEAEAAEFHQRVRDGYGKMAGADPQRWLVLDATLPKREISRMVWDRVRGLLPGEGLKAV